MEYLSMFFWVFFIFSMLSPWFKQKTLESTRINLIHRLEKNRGSRVISMIHRQETMSILGIPLVRYISIEDSEAVLRAIRLTDDNVPIDIILHTPGGLVLATEQIANALIRHKAKVTVFVPHYAMSGGTMLSLAADEIIMDENAVLGPVDPQIGQYPAISILNVLRDKDRNKIDDETIIQADIARKAITQVYDFLKRLLTENKCSEEKAENIARILTEGRWTHDYPIKFEEAKELGLCVSTDMPKEIYELMDLYPQRPGMRPSVQYIPVPYKKPVIPPAKNTDTTN
ncbi:MAG TPA: ATP-dependent Clp protease proteolytic subunit [Atribacterota bacterium]|nr:ATP-dependent Clp protease proteolytic subunit [Atribacterota bacterium]HOR42504.1 ATP-dependent Clp protease proteolytic subunit [Atribacterota bacterium]HPK87575.1 ATP-dependent Clp protease proteolytic subunit [Atribacterota bacterium]